MDYHSTTGASPSMMLEVQNGSQFEFFQSSQLSHASGYLSSSPYRCTDSPSSSTGRQDEDEAMEMMDDEDDDADREESPERRGLADDEFTSDVDRSFNSAMSVSASPCPYASSNGSMKSIFGTISQPAPPHANSNRPWQPASTTLGTASSVPSPLYRTENDRENENDDDSDYRHAQVELSPTGQKYAAKRAGMMFATMADVPSFATKVSMMGSKQQLAQPSKRPISTDLKQHFASTVRAFGRESAKANTMAGSTSTTSNSSTSTSPEIKGLMLPPPPPGQGRKDPFGELAMVPVLPSSSRTSAQAKKARPNSQGSSRRSSANSGYMLFRPSPTRIESAPDVHTSVRSSSTGSPVKRNSKSNMADAMLLDTPFRSGDDKQNLSPLTAFGDLPLETDADDFGNLFCDSPSAPTSRDASLSAMRMATAAAATGGGPAPRMGLKLSPLGNHSSSPASSVDSPSVARLAPTLRGMEKAISLNAASGGLFGSSARFGSNVTRRAQPYKRPQLATLTIHDGERLGSTASALSVLQNSGETTNNGFLSAGYIPPSVEGVLRRPNGLSMRRAFSVCDQSNNSNAESFATNDTDSSNASSGRVLSTIETSSNSALHPKIHGGGRLAAADGTAAANPASPFALGFGANEMDGKILPCHRVKEDGLVRITHETLRNLLDGHFDDRMNRFHIIDCRFEYEYSGGHIAGAINVNNTNAVESLLLKQGCGMYNDGEILPVPSRSGEGHEKPTVVVFHCEFSNKRAPAIAKFLRSRDRTLNNDVYPKVHYPELYILEGGYCDFFDKCPDKCEPCAYVPMDDPKHETKRDSDLHDFRKFTRTRSFTYGENQPQAVRPVQPCPRLAFDAASIAANRRAMAEKKENASDSRKQDHEMASPSASLARARLLTDVQESPGGDSLDGSPCARLLTSTSSGSQLFGSTKTRLLGRAVNRSTFMRTSSYAGAPSRG
ncbi:hypothetical protein QFC22_000536 [Naganishia vaughanmartiniae]|uniref:Uncharacterized protein n=1 Tax=Naganishia vaughanmartiniae TaxID=1424756 RepID=A0ACC2XNC4_9TREE|nr:hypothetical protein QFC22_000536 [Naganishia vaughanmartiniae]